MQGKKKESPQEPDKSQGPREPNEWAFMKAEFLFSRGESKAFYFIKHLPCNTLLCPSEVPYMWEGAL